MHSLLALAASAALIGAMDDAVVQQYHVRLAWTELRAPSCEGIGPMAPEPARTGFDFSYEIPPPRERPDGTFEGAPIFRLEQIVIEAPRVVAWPNMTEADREQAEAFRRALIHHEAGHVVTAERSLRALAETPPIVAPDIASYVARMRDVASAGEARFRRDQQTYESLTDHGRLQHRAPGALAGRDTVLVCEER